MNQDQYGSIMEKLGALAATQEAQGNRLEDQMKALDELERRYNSHLTNDHGHPPFANSRRRPVEVVLVAGRWGGGGLLVYAILEGLTRFFLGAG